MKSYREFLSLILLLFVISLTTSAQDTTAPVIPGGLTKTVTIAENLPIVTVVYNVEATDNGAAVDAGITYSLSGSEASSFAINTTTGSITLNQAANYEVKSSYGFVVTATDAANNASTQSVTLTVLDVNEPPVLSAANTKSVVENTTAVGTYTATDPEGRTLSYALKGTDAPFFTLTGAGVIAFASAPDYENPLDDGADNTYDISLQITDDVVPINIAPSATISSTVDSWLHSNTAASITLITDGDKVVDVHPQYADGKTLTFDFTKKYIEGAFLFYNSTSIDPSLILGSTVAFNLGGSTQETKTITTSSALITITPSSTVEFDQIVLTFFGSIQNFKEIEILAKEAVSRTTHPLAVKVTNVSGDKTPIIITGGFTKTITIAENTTISTVVYNVDATDDGGVVDVGITYSLFGTDAGNFNITTTGGITLKQAANHETKSSYSFIVRATNTAGNISYQAVTVMVTDLNDTPPVISLTTAVVYHLLGEGYVDSGVTALDDLGVDITKDISVGGSTVNVNAAGTYTITYNVDDAAGNSAVQKTRRIIVGSTFDVTVGQQDTAFVNNTWNRIPYGYANLKPTDLLSASFATIDDHINQGFSGVNYTKTRTSDGGLFEYDTTVILGSIKKKYIVYFFDGINKSIQIEFRLNAGILEFRGINPILNLDFPFPDFSVGDPVSTYNAALIYFSSLYTLDLITLRFEEGIPPVIPGGTTKGLTIVENATIATVLYDVQATDNGGAVDTGITYSLSGTDAGDFTITTDTGAITLKLPADFETKTSYSLVVTATDLVGNASSQTVTVAVTDVDDTVPIIPGSSPKAVSIAENATIATVVYDVEATDNGGAADIGITYSLSGTDADLFAIIPATGIITLKQSADFETKSSYSFAVTATDARSNASTQTVTVTVTDVDEVTLWTGGGLTGDPTDAANWSNGVPNSNSTVNIGATDQITLNTAITTHTVNIASGGSLIAKQGVAGVINYTRSLATNNWYLISSPVKGQSIDAFVGRLSLASGAVNTDNRSLGFYNNLIKDWSYYQSGTSNTDVFVPGFGRSIKLTAPGDISFTGTFNSDDVSIPITINLNGYNLIGNPYFSHISTDEVLTANNVLLAEQTVWIWNQSRDNYEACNSLNIKEIAPAQGFLVSAKTSSNFSITEAMQNHRVDTFQKTGIQTKVELSLSNGTSSKETDIFYVASATTGLDNGYDSSIFLGTPNAFEFYTHAVANGNGEKLAIQALPNSNYETTIVPIGVKAVSGSSLSFSAKSINLPAGIYTYLEDKLLTTFTRIDTASYQVMLSSDLDGVGRFYLHTRSNALSFQNYKLENVSVYVADKRTLQVEGIHGGEAKLGVYNILGKQLLNSSFIGTGSNSIRLPNLPTGTYLVKIQSEAGVLNKKIIIE